ncbi:fimbrial chaperone [Photobacterium damselae]|uniref:fimbrial chaperone n=1 Tax=Photobacterium damselae TaxID=38293 RepID=UPI004068A9B8
MNIKKLFWIVPLLFISISPIAQAAFILNGTRYIYDEGQKNMSVEINNESKELYGGQVWITNKNTQEVSFVPLPSFFKVEGKKMQLVRIMNVNPNLPKTRESLFWLNVQEIPPVNKNVKNAMVIAINTQVKLLYRPTSIQKGRMNAESKVEINKRNGISFIKNPTPYYFAITSLKINDKEVKISKELSNELGMFAPNSSIKLKGINIPVNAKVSFKAIDDYGAVNSYTISIG